jgi:hypothetical protein
MSIVDAVGGIVRSGAVQFTIGMTHARMNISVNKSVEQS